MTIRKGEGFDTNTSITCGKDLFQRAHLGMNNKPVNKCKQQTVPHKSPPE